MSKLRIVYIITLIILGVLLVFTVFRPMASVKEFTEMQRENLLETEDGWIVELIVINREGKDTEFSINAFVSGESYTETALVPNEGSFTYIYDIDRRRLIDDKVTFWVYKNGEDSPFEEINYYLK